MYMLNKLAALLETRLIKFLNFVVNSNNDLPYHDYHHVDETTIPLSYAVGTNQVNTRGDQKKLFVSKQTLVYCTENTTIRFNNTNNVAITILANTWYTFYCNIWQVFFTAITQDKDLYIYFEGTLPEEARTPE